MGELIRAKNKTILVTKMMREDYTITNYHSNELFYCIIE